MWNIGDDAEELERLHISATRSLQETVCQLLMDRNTYQLSGTSAHSSAMTSDKLSLYPQNDLWSNSQEPKTTHAHQQMSKQIVD